MKDTVIRLLRQDARLTAAEIAARLSTTEESVREAIANLEKEKTILGYAVITDESRIPGSGVMAVIDVRVRPEREGGFDKVAKRLARFPEVRSLYLMSGGHDLQVEVVGDNLQEVAGFVAEKLSTIDGVMSTATHFLLRKYKENGVLFEQEERNERLKVSP